MRRRVNVTGISIGPTWSFGLHVFEEPIDKTMALNFACNPNEHHTVFFFSVSQFVFINSKKQLYSVNGFKLDLFYTLLFIHSPFPCKQVCHPIIVQ